MHSKGKITTSFFPDRNIGFNMLRVLNISLIVRRFFCCLAKGKYSCDTALPALCNWED